MRRVKIADLENPPSRTGRAELLPAQKVRSLAEGTPDEFSLPS
ncbi:MAG: hypothetical protein QN168_00840 [Armatimonadota bacterium]|nr:hypothetical protein [Armatimonadota bacterium]